LRFGLSLGNSTGGFFAAGGSSSLGLGGAATLRRVQLLDAGGASLQTTEVVQLGAADRTIAGDFERLDQWRVNREDTLDADAPGNPAHRKVGGGTLAIAEANHDALECLDALAFALTDTEIDANGVAGGELRNSGVGFGLVDFGGVHFRVSVSLCWLI
jgi:hypothetical protein